MKRTNIFLKAFLFAALALGLAACETSSSVEWSTHTYETLGFEASFPGQPEESSQSVSTALGELDINMVAVEFTSDAYMVAKSEYPESYVNKDSGAELVETVLNGAVSGAAGNTGGTILSSEDATVGGYPAKNAKISFMDGSAVNYMQIILVGNTMYQLQALGEDKDALKANADKFFAGFKIL